MLIKLFTGYQFLTNLRTVKSYFGILRSPGRLTEFSKTGVERHCKILLDKIHINPGVHYQGGHFQGLSADVSEKPAKTGLASTVAPSMSKPAFVARQIPTFSLKADLLFEQVYIFHKTYF